MSPTRAATRASALHKHMSGTASDDRGADRADRMSRAEESPYKTDLANVEALRCDDEDELGGRLREQHACEQRISTRTGRKRSPNQRRCDGSHGLCGGYVQREKDCAEPGGDGK